MYIDRFHIFSGIAALIITGVVYAADASDFLVEEVKLVLHEINPSISRISKEEDIDGRLKMPHSWDYLDTHRQETKDLRIFGYNKNSFRNAPFQTIISPASHMLVSSSRREANDIYKKNFCEKDAMGISEILFVVPASNLIERKIDRAQSGFFKPSRRCARLTGRTLSLLNFKVGSTDQTSRSAQIDFGGMRADPKKHFLVTDFQEIDCL